MLWLTSSRACRARSRSEESVTFFGKRYRCRSKGGPRWREKPFSLLHEIWPCTDALVGVLDLCVQDSEFADGTKFQNWAASETDFCATWFEREQLDERAMRNVVMIQVGILKTYYISSCSHGATHMQNAHGYRPATFVVVELHQKLRDRFCAHSRHMRKIWLWQKHCAAMPWKAHDQPITQQRTGKLKKTVYPYLFARNIFARQLETDSLPWLIKYYHRNLNKQRHSAATQVWS